MGLFSLTTLHLGISFATLLNALLAYDMHDNFFLSKLDQHLSKTKDAFEALQEIIKHSREALKVERKQAEEAAVERAKSIEITSDKPMTQEEKDRHAVVTAFTPVLSKYGGCLPRFINYAVLIQLYSLFEDRGTALCNELAKRDGNIPLKLSEFTEGSPNFKSIKIYLTKLCGINFKHWSEIELLTQIRHRIVHNSGHTKDEKLIAQILKTPGLDIYFPPDSEIQHPDRPLINAKPNELDTDWEWDLEDDPNNVAPETEKSKPHIVVRYQYIDEIVRIVSGLFDQVFEQKGFGNLSPFKTNISDAGLIFEGTGDNLKVTVDYQD